jgi:hypothetical protein
MLLGCRPLLVRAENESKHQQICACVYTSRLLLSGFSSDICCLGGAASSLPLPNSNNNGCLEIEFRPVPLSQQVLLLVLVRAENESKHQQICVCVYTSRLMQQQQEPSSHRSPTSTELQ